VVGLGDRFNRIAGSRAVSPLLQREDSRAR
jgi:hypothetical protein